MDDIKIRELTNCADLATWLHDNGWSSPNDAQWTRIIPLWDEIVKLRSELKQSRNALEKLMQWAIPEEDNKQNMTIELSMDDYKHFSDVARIINRLVK